MDLQAIKAATDITEVIGNRIDLSEKNGRWWACCPFHDEDTPSLMVNPDRQSFHCFGCGERGDVFDFLQRFHQCGLNTAARMIAPESANGGRQVVKFRQKAPDIWKRIAVWKELHLAQMSESYRYMVFYRALQWSIKHPCYDQRTPIVRLYLKWRSEVVKSPAALSEYRRNVFVETERMKAIKRIFK